MLEPKPESYSTFNIFLKGVYLCATFDTAAYFLFSLIKKGGTSSGPVCRAFLNKAIKM